MIVQLLRLLSARCGRPARNPRGREGGDRADAPADPRSSGPAGATPPLPRFDGNWVTLDLRRDPDDVIALYRCAATLHHLPSGHPDADEMADRLITDAGGIDQARQWLRAAAVLERAMPGYGGNK